MPSLKDFKNSEKLSIVSFISSFFKNYFLTKINYQILLAKIKLEENFYKIF